MTNSKGGSLKFSFFIISIFLMDSKLTLASSGSFILESLRIPISSDKKPASNLLWKNQVITPETALELKSNGVDISALNPVDSVLWQNKKHSAQDDLDGFPDSSKTMDFQRFDAEMPYTNTFLVKPLNEAQTFRMSISRLSHATLLRSALLRKLGYYTPSPKYYSKLKIQFASAEIKDLFIKVSETQMQAALKEEKWILEEGETFLVLSDVILEKFSNEYFTPYWGQGPNPYLNTPEIKSALFWLSKTREYRAMILLFALTKIPESLNHYYPTFLRIRSGFIEMEYYNASSFAAATYEDLKWMSQRLCSLTNSDISEIIDSGKYPQELNTLLKAKILYRINQSCEFFNQSASQLLPLPDLNISNPEKSIVGGKVLQSKFEGYPQDFKHNDVDLPFEPSDYAKYLRILTKSSIIGSVLNLLNERLNLLTVDDAAKSYQKDLQKRIQDHIQNHPMEPLYQKIESWGGTLFGFSASASRSVATGTFFESTAPIQLVDNLSVGVSLGEFRTWNGFQEITPFVGAQLSLNRDYTHVLPIQSLKKGEQVEWSKIYVPANLKNLSNILEDAVNGSDKGSDTEQKKISEEEIWNKKQTALAQFFENFKEGEVFSITDSFSPAAYVQGLTSWSTLNGGTPLDFLNNISFGVDISKVLIRQTFITRTAEALQIFIRSQDGIQTGFQSRAQYFIDFLNFRISNSNFNIKTKAYVIDLTEKNPQKDLSTSLYNLLKNNNDKILSKKYSENQLNIQHHLDTALSKLKLFFFKVQKSFENHTLDLTPPTNKELPQEKPEDARISVFTSRAQTLTGKDWLGLFNDGFMGYLFYKNPKSNFQLQTSSDPNPANSPWGSARWRSISTEGDIGSATEALPTVTILQHVWGGWKLKKDDFLTLFNDIQKDFSGLKNNTYRLIEIEDFQNVKSLDFYRIQLQLSIMPLGIQSLMNKTKNQSFAEFFEKIVRMKGNGNFESGLQIYNEYCEHEKRRINSEQSFVFYSEVINKKSYFCLQESTKKLYSLIQKFNSSNKKTVIESLTKYFEILDQEFTFSEIINSFKNENEYFLTLQINGFKTGDAKADRNYFANTIGNPQDDLKYANGLISYLSQKSKVLSLELDRTQGGIK